MDRITRLIYSNKFVAAIMFIIQVAIVVICAMGLIELAAFAYILLTLLSGILIIYEINRTETPEFQITWIMLIAVVPVFGALLYVYIHSGILTKSIAYAHLKTKDMTAPHLKQDKKILESISTGDGNIKGLATYLSKYGGSPVYTNTSVTYYPIGDSLIKDMQKEIESAEHFIFMEFFIINAKGTVWKEMLNTLKEKVKQGVEVRILFDGMGCIVTLPNRFPQMMAEFGIKCREFSPVQPLLSSYQNNRDHRKILVVDGKTAFNGGVNLSDEYANKIERFGHWKDTGVKLQGDAVAGFTAMFLEMWNIKKLTPSEAYGKYILVSQKYSRQAGGFVIPYGDSPLDTVTVGKRVYIDSINNAKNYVYIMTPYLVIDNEMFEAMRYAVQRDVNVKIIMPGIPDKKYAFNLARIYYPELLEAGVEIYEYTPGFVHAKMLISDDCRAIVGTINFDYRSLYLHYECASFLYNVPAILDIKNDFDETLFKCRKMTMEEYKKIPLRQRISGKATRLVAPLI